MREKWFTVTVVSLVAVALLMYLFLYSVPENEVAVHERFGKVKTVVIPRFDVPGQSGRTDAQDASAMAKKYGTRVVTHAGWFWKLPWPFDRVRRYDQRIRHVDATQVETMLKDDITVIPRVYATWRVTDPVAIVRAFGGDVKEANDALAAVIETATGEEFGRRELGDLVGVEEGEAAGARFDEIERAILARVQQGLHGKDYGIEAYTLGITWVALPSDTTKTVFDRMRAERQRIARRYTDEGEALKQQRIDTAWTVYQKEVQRANEKAKEIYAAAEESAIQSYEVLAEDPELAIFLRRLEAFRNITQMALEGKQPLTFVLTPTSEPWVLLRQGAAGVEGTGGAAPGIPMPLEDAGSERPKGVPAGRATGETPAAEGGGE